VVVAVGLYLQVIFSLWYHFLYLAEIAAFKVASEDEVAT
jgi:hypothetical protein